MKKNIFLIMILLLISQMMFALSKGEEPIDILATNLWTAAYVEAATGEICPSLAPAEMSHPPEYELTPGDFDKLSRTRYLVFAGYEVMMKKIGESAAMDPASLIAIQTGYSKKALESSIMTIAEMKGTQQIARENLDALFHLMDSKKESLQNGSPIRALVHFHQQALARELGIDVAAVFGPAPLEAGDLEDITALEGINLIIDNGHNPVGTTLTEFLPESGYVQWINFPGSNESRTLMDVLLYNFEQLK